MSFLNLEVTGTVRKGILSPHPCLLGFWASATDVSHNAVTWWLWWGWLKGLGTGEFGEKFHQDHGAASETLESLTPFWCRINKLLQWVLGSPGKADRVLTLSHEVSCVRSFFWRRKRERGSELLGPVGSLATYVQGWLLFFVFFLTSPHTSPSHPRFCIHVYLYVWM